LDYVANVYTNVTDNR